MHSPVLLNEAIEGLKVISGGLYIDATAGEGGHLKKILGKGGRVLGIDLDEDQINENREKIKSEKLTLVVGNFADIEKIAKSQGFSQVDGILFDLGLSYSQLSFLGRGFSYRRNEEPLDMRLSLRGEIRAADLVNSLSEDELYVVLAKNAEEINSRAIAHAIVSARRLRKIKTVGELLGLIDGVVGGQDEKVYARVFQALRMEVNEERSNLKKGLKGAMNLIKNEGRLVTITFHSVEDRMVKKFFIENKLKQIKKLKGNKTSRYERSATLRVMQK